MSGVFHDLKHGTRMLLKNPGFTLVAVLSIAIGVGANAAMFSVADGLVLRPLQVPHVDDIIAINTVMPRANDTFISNRLLSYPDYRDVRDRTRSFAGVLAYTVLVTGFADRSDQPVQSKLGLSVSGNFFDVLQLQPAAGRFFLPDEDRVPGRDAVIVLAYKTWADRFGSDHGAIGRRIRLGGRDFTVIGVAPEQFSGMHLALPPAYYIPFSIAVTLPGSFPEMLEQRTIRGLEVRARVRPKVSVDQAREEVALLANALEQAYPDTNRNVGLLVRTSFQARLDERGPSAPAAFMLLTLAFVVLLVACANVAGLLTSRGPERQREIALRMAIGGDRFRVTRQLITESLLLAAAGGALGLAMAAGAMVFLSRLPLVSDIGVHLTFDLDRRAIVVGIALATASAFLSSLVPAWRATRAPTLATTLRTTADHAHGPVRLWGRNGLVAAQVALSLMLLTVTVSMYRAFEMELGQPGFKTTHMLLASFEPRLARYDESRSEAFFKLLKERVRGVAGVRAVGMTSVMPLNQDTRDPATIVPEGFQLPRGTDSIIVLTSRIDEGYLDTMGIPIVRGRNIQTTDTADSARVALVNQTTASRYWPGQDPIGKRIRFMDRNGQPWIEVVGVTADSKSNWIGEGPTPWIYVSRLQDPGFRTTVLIASAADSASIASSIRDVVRDIDPNMPVAGMRTMEEFYDGNATGMVRALVRIVGTMGLLGLTLGMIGLYGLVAYVVARRTREIGIRMAVGAKPGTVLRSVLGSGAVLAASGIAVGVLGCIAIRGLLQSVFPGTGGIDLATYALVVPTLVAVTLIASYIPARRAAQIDPLRALRTE